ncbi:MAG: protein translocase subunit SecF [Lachnospiraceae bacterium]|jgi:preprotein translocase SecF subunit|nr:protein translocase subunit SecF [Lachnospiraceae bacterium]
MKVIERTKLWFSISLVIILLGIISFIFRGLNYDIEFAGGTMLQIDMHQSLEENARLEEIVKEISGDSNPQVQAVSGSGSDTQITIKVKEIKPEQIDELYMAIANEYGLDTETKADLIEHSSISPTISSEMKKAAIVSTIIAGVLMLLYISLRFRDICFGLGSLIPLLHDVLIVVAVYTLFQIPVNNTFIVALLTIVGYSINNTIVVFDRIRENRRFYRKNEMAKLCDVSIQQTLGRSLGTSFTTIITVFLLFLLGVQSLRWFALPLLVGILAGTYSSLFIASPVWYLLETKFHK